MELTKTVIFFHKTGKLNLYPVYHPKQCVFKSFKILSQKKAVVYSYVFTLLASTESIKTRSKKPKKLWKSSKNIVLKSKQNTVEFTNN